MTDQQDQAASRLAPAWMRSRAFPRVLPFALFMVFVAAGSLLPPPDPPAPGQWDARWIYALRGVVVGVVLVWLWRWYEELRDIRQLRFADWSMAIASGLAVLAIWVVLDGGWVSFELGKGFDPRRYGSEDIDWTITAFRLFGLAIVVPLAEELFWRSFLMRWLERQEFLAVAPAAVGVRALLVTSVLFALEHSQWLAGLIAGVVYGWVYLRSGNLWTPVIAHAVTNGALGAYILMTRDWRFW